MNWDYGSWWNREVIDIYRSQVGKQWVTEPNQIKTIQHNTPAAEGKKGPTDGQKGKQMEASIT